VIRRANPEDAAGIAPLLDELGYPSTAAQVEARLAALPAGELVLVAELDGQVAGLAGLRVEPLIERDDPSGRLTALVVGSRWRGRGLGETLVRAVEEEARARGCERVVLSSGTHRDDAHGFYERVGYEVTGRRFAKQL
jgi:ribosomal protein S18 acetylase RimI-like enzyme